MSEHLTKQRRGCLFYGCLTVSALLVVVLIATLFGLRYFKKTLNDFTDTQPLPLPVVQVSQAQLEQIQQRIALFKQALQDHRPAPPLVLTTDDINALIASGSVGEALKGKLYVTAEGGRVTGQISVPMDEMGLPVFRGRYLNGTAAFNVALRGGVLLVTADSIRVKGRLLPDLYLDKIRKQNLAQGVNQDPQDSGFLGQLQDVQVQDGSILLVPKPPP